MPRLRISTPVVSLASLTRFAPAAAPSLTLPSTASVASAPTSLLAALGANPLSGTGGSPLAPLSSNLTGALSLLRRDPSSPVPPGSVIGLILPPTATPPLPSGTPTQTAGTASAPVGDTPSADDTIHLDGIGTVGKYMLQSDGTVSNYGGQKTADGKTLDEPIDVIILDPNSTSEAESQAKVNKDMTMAGFGPQVGHSGGFKGTINGQTYNQQPSGPLMAYSDASALGQNDHGRLFGPAKNTEAGQTGVRLHRVLQHREAGRRLQRNTWTRIRL